MDQFRLFRIRVFIQRLPFICLLSEIGHHISINSTEQLEIMELQTEGPLYACDYSAVLHSEHCVRNGWTKQLWHNATQLNVILICDAPLKDSHLIWTAMEPLKCCDMEQKIHLKSTLEGINLDVILTITSQGHASRKLQTDEYLSALNFS